MIRPGLRQYGFKRARYPRFKSRNGRQSAEYTRSGFRYRDGRLYLAKMDTPLEFTWSWPDIDPAAIDPSTVTVSRDPCGRWYVSLAVEVADPEQLPATGAVVGVDLGIKDFTVTSGGEKIANPRKLARREQALARYQRRLARCQRGSANRVKAKAKVARAHRKVRASRTDFLHRTSARLVRDHDVIVIEDLAVQNMVRNRSLAKAISDCGWGTFRQMIEYKTAKAGRHLIVAGRWYPSSKTCSACGHLLASLTLNTRTWQCPSAEVMPAFLEAMLRSPRLQKVLLAGSGSTAQPHLYLRDLRQLQVPVPALSIQESLVVALREQLAFVDQLETDIKAALERSERLRVSILAAAFSGRLVPQDDYDEPASVLLARIAAERASSNGRSLARTRAPRVPREKVSI